MQVPLEQRISEIFERAKDEALTLVCSVHEVEREAVPVSPAWMTDSELARYWRLTREDGEPVTAGIRSWVKRARNEHPLPCAYMGDLLRFNRDEVDQWAREEAALRSAKRARRQL